MPILTQCPHCGKKFRAPDQLAGKSVKCPGCQGPVRVAESPADKPQATSPVESSSASWYILTENREQMGPVSKDQLDNLATKGRLSFCKIRRGDWRSWKWADDVYPDLPAATPKQESAAAAPPGPESPDAGRLVLCPDCGNTVSRRAAQCPHCGCPAAVLLKQPAAAQDSPMTARPPAPAPVPEAAGNAAAAEAAAEDAGAMSSRRWRRYAIAAGFVLVAGAVVAPIVC